MKTEENATVELVNLKFSMTANISKSELENEVKKIKAELEEITKKKQVDYEKLKAIVKL